MKASLNSLSLIATKIKELLPEGGVVLLVGDLASGKTTLVKAFARHIGVEDEVNSPTFSILQEYADEIFHYDIYNEGTRKFIESGLMEKLESKGYHFIEWADEDLEKIIKDFGFKYIKIEILPYESEREYRFEA